MGKNPILTFEVYRAGFEVAFHYSKAFLDFPSAFVGLDDTAHAVVEVSAYSIETIIFFFVSNY